MGKTKGCQKPMRPGGDPATTVRPCTLPHFPNAAFYACLGPQVLSWIIRLGPIGLLFASSHDFVWPILHAFLLTLGTINVNLKSKPKQAKTKHNQINMGINRKMIQISPKIESKSLKIPMLI